MRSLIMCLVAGIALPGCKPGQTSLVVCNGLVCSQGLACIGGKCADPETPLIDEAVKQNLQRIDAIFAKLVDDLDANPELVSATEATLQSLLNEENAGTLVRIWLAAFGTAVGETNAVQVSQEELAGFLGQFADLPYLGELRDVDNAPRARPRLYRTSADECAGFHQSDCRRSCGVGALDGAFEQVATKHLDKLAKAVAGLPLDIVRSASNILTWLKDCQASKPCDPAVFADAAFEFAKSLGWLGAGALAAASGSAVLVAAVAAIAYMQSWYEIASSTEEWFNCCGQYFAAECRDRCQPPRQLCLPSTDPADLVAFPTCCAPDQDCLHCLAFEGTSCTMDRLCGGLCCSQDMVCGADGSCEEKELPPDRVQICNDLCQQACPQGDCPGVCSSACPAVCLCTWDATGGPGVIRSCCSAGGLEPAPDAEDCACPQ